MEKEFIPMFRPPALGWQCDLPDSRDYSTGTAEVQQLLALAPEYRGTMPTAVDLRDCFPEVHDQQQLNTSASHACAGMYEYFERRSHGRLGTLSRLFLHQNSHLLLGNNGDSPIGIRSTLRAMRRCGVPPERLWQYSSENAGATIPPHLYAFSDSFRSLVYLRFDERNCIGTRTLQLVRAFLAAGFPIAFGFVVPDSISPEGEVPYRPTLDDTHGGQAAIAVGYDDRRLTSSRGALLVRSSWGPSWGEDGYGWLPYAFVEQQLAADFWTLLKAEWLSTGEFLRPRFEE